MNERQVIVQAGGRAAGLFLVRKPVRTVVPALREPGQGALRDGTTGRVIATLPRVWAVAAPTPVPEPETTKEGVAEEPQAAVSAVRAAPVPELAFYRKYTEAMLRRYLRLSMEAGRVPSLLGRELFRGNVTSYRVKSFEDVVIFCHDIEKCLMQLKPLEWELIKRITLQEYSQGEAAAMLGMSLRSCIDKYCVAVDRLTSLLLRLRLMEPLKSCQEGKAPSCDASD